MVVGTETGAGQGSTGSIGYKVRGSNDDIFIQNRQMEIRGDAAMGIEHTAVTVTPTCYNMDVNEFFNRDQIFFKMDSSDADEEAQINVVQIREGDPVSVYAATNSLAFDVVSGIVNVTALVVTAAGPAGRLREG